MFQNKSDIHSAAANIDVICKNMKKTSSFPIFICFYITMLYQLPYFLSFMPTSISVIRTLLKNSKVTRHLHLEVSIVFITVKKCSPRPSLLMVISGLRVKFYQKSF